MSFKTTNIEVLAKTLGVNNVEEIREKQKLIELIKKIRLEKKLSQIALAKKIGITQGRIAQIESGVGTRKVTFDILFNILKHLGYECKILTKKAS